MNLLGEDLAMNFDAIVIGAGPAGSSAAREIASAGFRVGLFEEHELVGVPQHCAGMLTVKGCRLLKIEVPDHVIQSRPRMVKISYKDLSFEFPFKVYVVDRGEFDRYLAEKAVEAGALLKTGSRVRGIRRRNDRWIVSVLGDGEHESKLVIGAEGFKVLSVEWVGLKRSRDNAVCLQYEIEVPRPVDQNVIECIFGSDKAPGGYAWIVPIGEKMLRVGLGVRRSRRSPSYYLEKLLREGFQQYKVIRKMAGIVSVGGPMTPSYTDGYMAVGEAAGQVNPLFGMGCLSSIACGRIAGKVAARALKKGDTSARQLKEYEDKWWDLVGRNYVLAMEIRNLLESEKGQKIIRSVAAAYRSGSSIGKTILKVLSMNPSLLKYALSWSRIKRIAYY